MIINYKKYVHHYPDGLIALTDYAWDNISECTIHFTYHKVSMKKHGEYHTDVFHRVDDNAYEKPAHYDSDSNVSVVDLSKELKENKTFFR